MKTTTKKANLDELRQQLSERMSQNTTSVPDTRQKARVVMPRQTRAQFKEKAISFFPPDLVKLKEIQLFLAQNDRPASASQAVRIALRSIELNDRLLLIDAEVRGEDLRYAPRS